MHFSSVKSVCVSYAITGGRNQRDRLNRERIDRLITRWLPQSRIGHPYPDLSMYVSIDISFFIDLEFDF